MSLMFYPNSFDADGASYSGINGHGENHTLELNTWSGEPEHHSNPENHTLELNTWSGEPEHHSNPEYVVLIGMTNRDVAFLDHVMAAPNEGLFLNSGMEFLHQPEFLSPRTSLPSSLAISSLPPTLGRTASPMPSTNEISVGLGACSLDRVHLGTSIKSTDSDKPDTIVHWYGPDCRSPQESVDESFERHQALLQDYIHSSTKLATQIDFMKKQRKKRKTDSNLVQDYRFIVSLYQALMTKEFKGNQRVSSKAILACLDVNASWVCRAKKVVRLLDKFGPEGTSPDPLVIKRLQSRVIIHKGSDLLAFLRERESQLAQE